MWWDAEGERPWSRRRPNLELGITPLIDIVFQLLIFFMLTSRFVLQQGIDFDLPATRRPHPLGREEARVIHLSREGRVSYQGATFTLAGFERRLDADGWGAATVEILADRQTPIQAVVSLLEALRDRGVGRVSVGTTVEPRASGP